MCPTFKSQFTEESHFCHPLKAGMLLRRSLPASAQGHCLKACPTTVLTHPVHGVDGECSADTPPSNMQQALHAVCSQEISSSAGSKLTHDPFHFWQQWGKRKPSKSINQPSFKLCGVKEKVQNRNSFHGGKHIISFAQEK